MNTRSVILIHLLITVGLIILAIISAILFIQDRYGLLSLQTAYPISQLKWKSPEMYSGNSITGQFDSKYPNLGLIAINWKTSGRPHTGELEFRIKETDGENWLYSGQHVSSNVFSNKPYPFGFPVIKNSENKSYTFELRAHNTATGSGVILDTKAKQWIAKHQFNWTEISTNYKTMAWFAARKLSLLVSDSKIVSQLVVYTLPLLLFLSITLSFNKYPAPLVIIFSTILYDILVVEDHSEFLFISVMLGWGFLSWRHRLDSRISILISAVLLGFLIVFKYQNEPTLAENFAVWSYFFLLAATIQRLYEMTNPSRQLVKSGDFMIQVGRFALDSTRFAYTLIMTEDTQVVRLLESKIGARMMRPLKSVSYILAKIIRPFVWLIVKFFIVLYLGIVYGSIGWLLWQIGLYINSYIDFYRDFFPAEQFRRFLTFTGIYLSILYIAIVAIFLICQLKFRFKQRLLVGLLSLYLALNGGQFIFNKTTEIFRGDIYVTSVSPERVTLWDEAVVTGRNFKNMPFIGKVLVAGIEHRVISWSDKKIVFQVEPGKTTSGEVVVIDSNGRQSNPLEIEAYDFFTKETIR